MVDGKPLIFIHLSNLKLWRTEEGAIVPQEEELSRSEVKRELTKVTLSAGEVLDCKFNGGLFLLTPLSILFSNLKIKHNEQKSV